MKKIYLTLILLALFSFRVADNRSIYNIPLQARAVSSVDYDLDGDNDIIITHGIDQYDNWGGIYMLQNDGYGHFAFMDSIFEIGLGKIYPDAFINTGTPDLLYRHYDSIKILSKEADDYVHRSFVTGSNISRISYGFINNDSYLDVAFISSLEQYWGVIYNNGNGTFTAPEYQELDYPPTDITCGDLNNDGRDDVIVVGQSSLIFFSTESGFEMHDLQKNALLVKIADFDIDGDLDIITFSDAYTITYVHLYKNLSNNTFDTVSNFNIDKGCSDFFIADFNNDSLPDVLFRHHSYPAGFILYFNQGAFQFGVPVDIDLIDYGEARKYACVEDMDGNSFVDIVVTRTVYDTNIAPSLLEILFNDGHGNFVEYPLNTNSQSIKNITTKLINYPNPFKISTTFEFTIKETSHIELSVYNLQGQLVKSLTNKKMKGGKHQIKWGGLNNAGQACKPGPYIAYLKVNGSFIQSIKIIMN